jgi:small-conductance mechanosensitive channel
VPNKQINGEILTNAVSGRGITVAVPLPITIAPDAAMAEIAQVIAAVPGVASKPPVDIGIDALTPDGVSVELRYWVAAGADHFSVRHQANRALLGLLEKLGVRAPAGAKASGEA